MTEPLAFFPMPLTELIQTFFDRKFCEEAIAEARKSVAEDDRPHPKVGVVIVQYYKPETSMTDKVEAIWTA